MRFWVGACLTYEGGTWTCGGSGLMIATTGKSPRCAIPDGVDMDSKGRKKMAKATARHILVKTETEALNLKEQIENGADFGELAKKHSSCPSSRDGGNLGSFGPGQMVPEFDQVVFSAPVGVVQGPVKTQFGMHLVEVTSRQD
ncbi:peptidylprolyl isomerase [Streptomyces lydicus]